LMPFMFLDARLFSVTPIKESLFFHTEIHMGG